MQSNRNRFNSVVCSLLASSCRGETELTGIAQIKPEQLGPADVIQAVGDHCIGPEPQGRPKFESQTSLDRLGRWCVPIILANEEAGAED